MQILNCFQRLSCARTCGESVCLSVPGPMDHMRFKSYMFLHICDIVCLSASVCLFQCFMHVQKYFRTFVLHKHVHASQSVDYPSLDRNLKLPPMFLDLAWIFSGATTLYTFRGHVLTTAVTTRVYFAIPSKPRFTMFKRSAEAAERYMWLTF